MILDRPRAHAPGTVWKFCLALAAVWPATHAIAQTTAPGASAASAPAPALTPEERAKREGDQVFRWILIHSDKPRKPVAAKEDKPAAVVTRVKPPVRSAEPVVEANAPATTAATTATAARAATGPASPPPAAVEAAGESALANAAGAAATTSPPPVAATEQSGTEALTLVSQTEPQFPASLLRTLRTGQVQVKFTVLPDGSVAEPAVVSTSNPRLNPSALAAVAQWRFAPVRKAQQGVVDLGFNNDQ